MARQQVQDDGFATMMLSQGDQLMRVAWHVLHEPHLAEDAVAGSYLRAWQRRGSLRDQGKLGPWLRTICRREALRLARARRQWPQREADGFVMARVSDKIVALPGDTAEVRELLERLPEHLRTCAELFFGANGPIDPSAGCRRRYNGRWPDARKAAPDAYRRRGRKVRAPLNRDGG